MITENLSTLKIHKLTQAQYERELANGTIDPNAIYLTPDEEVDLSIYASIDYVDDQLDTKANVVHNHNDDYYTEDEIDSKLSSKSDVNHTHSNYVPITRKVNGKELNVDIALTASDVGALPSTTNIPSIDGLATESYVDGKIAAIPTPDVSGQINTHNTSATAHSDIRTAINTLSNDVDGKLSGKSDTDHKHDSDYDKKGDADKALASAQSYTDEKIALLMDNSSEAVDSIMELATAMQENEEVVDALEQAIGTKANASDLTSHISNKSNPHGVDLPQLGITATAAELNIMDGVTATTAEINKLDGVTATTAELNYVDGVTSNIQVQLDGKAASDHTHNYAGSSSAGGAATSANKVNKSLIVQLNGGTTEGTNKFTFDGSTAKSVNITASSVGAAASSHSHDDKYYTESEIDSKVTALNTAINGKANSSHTHAISDVADLQASLDRKADTSHGNHVPATETANNAKFLRNDNTWQTVTPANIGALKIYTNITDLGLTEASATAEQIALAMSDNSMLLHTASGTATSSALGLPVNWGLLRVIKRTSSYVEFDYNSGTQSWSSYYNHGSSSGTKWYDWRKNITSDVKTSDIVPIIIGTQTAATGTWTGKASTITSLYDGLTIKYYLPYAGSGNATLNLTLANGTTTGAINCYYSGSSRLTTHYGAGSLITLTYYKAGSIKVSGTATTDNRWIADADYSSVSVSQTVTTTNAEYPLLTTVTASKTASGSEGARFASGVTLNPSTSTITAKNSNGSAFQVQNNTYKASLRMGSGGTNRGVYDDTNSKWMVYADENNAIHLNGNASSATKLATARTISLTGDVTGSASFNGSANVSITATVADSSHNHAASNIAAGTLAGRVDANATAQATLANLTLRNIYAKTTDMTPGSTALATGQICLIYE